MQTKHFAYYAGGGIVYSEHNTEEITWSSILQPQATAFT
jgi:hypothetical protein